MANAYYKINAVQRVTGAVQRKMNQQSAHIWCRSKFLLNIFDAWLVGPLHRGPNMHRVAVSIHIYVCVHTYIHRPEKKTILLEKECKLQIQAEVWFL